MNTAPVVSRRNILDVSTFSRNTTHRSFLLPRRKLTWKRASRTRDKGLFPRQRVTVRINSYEVHWTNTVTHVWCQLHNIVVSLHCSISGSSYAIRAAVGSMSVDSSASSLMFTVQSVNLCTGVASAKSQERRKTDPNSKHVKRTQYGTSKLFSTITYGWRALLTVHIAQWYAVNLSLLHTKSPTHISTLAQGALLA